MNKGLKRTILFWFIILIIVWILRAVYFLLNGSKTSLILWPLLLAFPILLIYIGFLFRRLFKKEIEIRLNEEKAVTEKLGHSEEMLRAAQKIAKIGYWEEFVVSGEINFSEELINILDLEEKEENINKKLQLDFLHKDEHDLYKIKIKELYDYGSVEWDHRIITAGGNVKYLLERISMIRKDNAPFKLVGVVQDVSERKLAELKTIQSEQYYKNLFEGAKDAIILFYPENEIVIDVNQRACEMYGFSREEFIGMSIVSISKYPERGKERVLNTLAERQYYHFKSTQFKKDGTELHLDITASIIDYFGEEIILSINRDETEPRLAEEKIRLLSLGIEQHPHPIVITNTEAEIEYVNHAFEQVTQYTYDEVRGKNPRILQSGEVSREVYNNLWKTLLSGKEWRGEFKNKKKDGTLYWELAVIFPLVDSNNKTKQYFASKMDITERKDLEHQLRLYRERLEFLVNERTQRLKESEETFRALSENSADIIMRFDRNVEHLYVNPAAEKIFNLPASEFIGKKYENLNLKHEIFTLWEKAVKKVFESGKENMIELQLPNEKWFDCRLYPEYNENGEVVSVITSTRDISLLKETERDLSKKERLLRGVAEASNKLLSLDSFYKRINQVLEIMGKAAGIDRIYIFENSREPKTGELLMNQIYEWISPDVKFQSDNLKLQRLSYKKAGFEEGIEILTAGQPFSIMVKDFPPEKRKIHEEKNLHSMLIMPVEIGESFWGFVCFDECKYERVWDESEISILKILASDLGGAFTRKLIEDALMNTEERFKSLFDFAPIPYFIVDPKGMFIDVNNSLEKTLGYSKNEISGKKRIQTFIHSKEDRDIIENVLAGSHGGASSGAVEMEVVHKNGKKIMIELNTYPITLGERRMVLCAAHDVSLRKETENEIRTALTHSQELNEIKSRFVSMVSHEFRTPLSTILSSVEILRLFESRLRDEEKTNHYRKITKSIDYLTNLLDDVITINRADSGRLLVKFKTVDIMPLLDQWILDIKASFTETPEIIFEKHHKEIKAELDENLFKQIVYNLLNNAIKYTPANKKIEIAVIIKNENFVVQVKDEGIGIPTDSQSEIFSPFYRAMNTGNVPGSGLGLAVAKRSVEILHGEISFNSKENKGTTFNVIIPLKKGQNEKNIAN